MNLHGKDPFEQQLRDSLNEYEVPYNSADWAQMDRALSSGVKGWSHGRTLLTAAAVAGLLLVAGTAYYLGRDTGVQQVAQAVPVQVDKAAATVAPVQENLSNEIGKKTGTSSTPAIEDQSGPDATGATVAHATPATSGKKGKSTRKQAAVPPPAPKPANLIRSSVNEACLGTPVDFTVEHMPEDGIFLWNFGDGSFSNKANPEHTFTKPGSYQVILSISGPGAGGMQNKLSSGTITVQESPVAAFNIEKRDFAGKFPLVHFENTSQGATSYLWDLGDGTKSTEARPDHVYKAKGKYTVVLTVTNGTGCTDTKAQDLEVGRDFTLGAPEQFSASADGGSEGFMPSVLKTPGTEFQLSVYDAAGMRVYTTNKANEPWMGKVNNQGALCAPGDYVWAVDIRSDNAAPETFTGKVTLVR